MHFLLAVYITLRNMTRQSSSLFYKGLEELGLLSLWQAPRDAKLLIAQRFVRLFAYGGSTLILASYLSALDISDDHIGLFMTLTLVGDVAISFLLTLFADALGRRAVLALGSALMVGSGIIFTLFGNYWVLLAAAVFGVISPRYVSVLDIPRFPTDIDIVAMRLVPSKQLRSPLSPISLHMNYCVIFCYGTLSLERQGQLSE